MDLDKYTTIAVPSGIGDSLWSMTKVSHIKKKTGKDIAIIVQETGFNRSDEFLSRFAFVDRAEYRPFAINSQDVFDPEGPYIYLQSTRAYQGWDWLLIPNGHLERGHRLEEWMPELETDFTIGKQWKFDPVELQNTVEFQNKIGPYVIFFLSGTASNTIAGHNRGPLWKPNDWLDLAKLLHTKYNVSVVIVGDKRDRSYVDDFIAIHDQPYIINLVGETKIGQTYAHILHAKAVFSYQSGIGIFSVYLGIPTVLWWRPYGDSISPNNYVTFKEEMASAWAPPWSLTNGRYLPQIYTRSSPLSIMHEIENRGWMNLERDLTMQDSMLLDVGSSA